MAAALLAAVERSQAMFITFAKDIVQGEKQPLSANAKR